MSRALAGRRAKGWYRKARGGVYVEIQGRQYLLAKGPNNAQTWKEAEDAYYQLMAEMAANPPVDGGDPTVASIIDEYLEYSVRRDASSTFYERKLYLQDFCTHYGPKRVNDCKPYHLSKWVDGHATWKSDWTKHYAMRCVMRPFNWAVKMKLVPENPFMGVEWPTCTTERRPLTAGEFEALLKAAGPNTRLGEILRFLVLTGCRPVEARHLKWSDIRWDTPVPVIISADHKTSRTQATLKPRVIPLVPEAVELVREIAKRREHEEYVFVTPRRSPWARSSIQQKLRRLRREIGLPEDVVLYGIRHSVGTHSVRSGNSLRTTADLLGHTQLRTTERYVHSIDQIGDLAAAMDRATKSARCV